MNPSRSSCLIIEWTLGVVTQTKLYQRFAPAEARRILSRLEFHFTPKHASWLNMVEIEIEIGVMVRQCLSRRIAAERQLHPPINDNYIAPSVSLFE